MNTLAKFDHDYSLAATPLFTKEVEIFFERANDKLVCDKANSATQNPSYQEHFSRSKEAIAKAIEGLKNTALILGAGAANDLPLRQLAEGFDRVVLVDMNLKHTRKALEEIPENLQSKFYLEQIDLTGFFSELDAAAENLFKKGLSFNQFVSEILNLLPRLERKELDYQRLRSSFVSSSLICSQLSGTILDYLETLSQKVYRQSFITHSGKAKELVKFMIQIQINHFKDLHKLVDLSGGKIYFADHFSAKGVVNLTSELEKKRVELGEQSFPGVAKIQASIEDLFSTSDKKTWYWALPIRESTGTVNIEEEDGSVIMLPTHVLELREYRITSLNLSPKIK